MTQLIFRPLLPSDASQLDDTGGIMAAEDFSFAFDYAPGEDFEAYLELLEDRRLGRNARQGSIASTFEVGVCAGRIAVRLSVRHALNDFLLRQGGHIGYGVLPEFRRRGFGSAALRRGLELTSSLGISSTLVTCDEDNEASRRIIEHTGGRYESSHLGADMTVAVRRYWFERDEVS